MKKTQNILLLGIAGMMHLSAQTPADSTQTAVYKTTRTQTPPAIDGVLDDACWTTDGVWSGGFTQQRPDEGQPSTEKTEMKIVYDDKNVYVAFRAYDAEPAKINRWLSPRDQIRGDAVCIVFDSYNDKRTGFAFALTAAGTKSDFLCSNFDNDDYTWNAVWEGRTSLTDKGWFAEFRIPLSQLRYSTTESEQEWGFAALRFIDRRKEQSFLHPIPQINNGFIYSFGRLSGLSGLPTARRVELTPYTTVRYESTTPVEEGNPYSGKDALGFGAGLDGKIGLSSDFTLDFTINPDFGQVEADPSTMNLTAFETYYNEKRPFFLEGKNIFSGMGEALFYSRRIGSRPLWQPDEQDNRFSKIPKETTILSAVKVSGKNKDGLSVGLLHSLTAKETARITDDGNEYKMTAQPFVSYAVARVQKDFSKGNTVLGGMFTSTNRMLEEHLKGIARNAYTGAIDFEQYMHNREYYVKGVVQYSRVEGHQEAITNLQRSPAHFFQREGTTHLGVDSARTHLQGSAGRILIGRRGQNNKLYTEHTFEWATPGFDPNDAGYIEAADYMVARGYMAYTEPKPVGIFRNYTLDLFYRYRWNHGKTYTLGRFGGETNMNFTNKYFLYACLFYDARTVESAMLRGGPPVLVNPRWGTDFVLETDNSKRLSGIFYHGTVLGDKRYAQFAFGEINYRPISNLNLSARLTYSYWNKALEYAGNPENAAGKTVYLLGALRQETLFLTLRADYSITPDLSIQFYGNPFFSSGKYTSFKRATQTMDKTYENRFQLLEADVLTYDASENVYSVHESSGEHYTFDNPDFSFREFRFNLVARWEYRPNSVLYLVWGQERSGNTSDFIASVSQNTKALFKYHPGNVLMLKLNYWFAI